MMRCIRAAGIALALFLAVLSGQVSVAGGPGPGDAGAPDGGRGPIQRGGATALPVVEPDVRAPGPTPTDPCAQFNARPRLSPEEHQRRYGCPPCPCACVRGEIICAPCAACRAFNKGDAEQPEATPPPKRTRGQP